MVEDPLLEKFCGLVMKNLPVIRAEIDKPEIVIQFADQIGGSFPKRDKARLRGG